MANIVGPGRRHALETRRSPYKPEGFICRKCSRPGQFVYVRKCRVYQDGLMRPGVQCPQCLTAWMEAEDQPPTLN